MIEIFAMEYKKRSKGDNNAARTQTTFRYCSALWRDWHQYKHDIKIAASGKGKASRPKCGTLNEEVSAILQMLTARGEQRLREGILVDTVSRRQNLITDAQVVAVVRFVVADGTVFNHMKLLHFLLLLNYHRRAGTETYAIQQGAFELKKYADHNIVLVRFLTL